MTSSASSVFFSLADAVILREAPRESFVALRAMAPTEESAGWSHGAVGHDGSTREAPPVSDKDSSVGARPCDGKQSVVRRLPQNDTDRPHTVLS
jgi:hypothetical protein